ncbi:MAG: DUF3750 domain-containing protein [Elusimicrobiota bacterium]
MHLKTLVSLAASLLLLIPACAADWRTATRESAGIAPKPEEQKEAVVQVYAARAVRWRGLFAVHTWIAVKKKDAARYTTYQVIGWRLRRGRDALAVAEDVPDRHWFGKRPALVAELIGPPAESAIPKIEKAAAEYPYPRRYRAWPGPNSNTFVSFILRRVPELRVELPPHAVGKDWIGRGDLIEITESGTGWQLSLFGLLGLSLGAAEGLEVNVLGLNFGFDLLRPALKLPMAGRVGLRDKPPTSPKPMP